MAKKKAGGPNKSAAIREYLKTHPKAGPTEVCKALKKAKNMDLAPALVSNVRAAMEGRKGGKKKRRGAKPGPKAGRPAGRPAASSTDKIVSSLIEARAFADKVGGVEQAQALLKALSKLG